MKKIIIVTFGFFFFFLFCFNSIHTTRDKELGSTNLSILKLEASASGVEGCYSSATYNSGGMPGSGYQIIYGERML